MAKKTPKRKSIAKRLKGRKVFEYTGSGGKRYRITERQKIFCEKYCEFGASGVDAVFEAGYKVKNKNVAYGIAHENLRKPKIFEYIHLLYKEYGFNDEDVFKEHLFLIKQNADLTNKAKGIDMYYKKKGEYAPEKHEHLIKNEFEGWTPEELERYAKTGEKPKRFRDS